MVMTWKDILIRAAKTGWQVGLPAAVACFGNIGDISDGSTLKAAVITVCITFASAFCSAAGNVILNAVNPVEKIEGEDI